VPDHEHDVISMCLGKRQEACGTLARQVGVGFDNVRGKQSLESPKQQLRILGRLTACFSLFNQ
jgi:hypothetical protein